MLTRINAQGVEHVKKLALKVQKYGILTIKPMATNLEYCHLCTICAGKCPEQAIQVIRDDEDEKKNIE